MFARGDIERVGMLTLAVVGLAMAGCDGGSNPASGCDGKMASVDGRRYCVGGGAITETGFRCPDGYPHRHRHGQLVICSKSKDPPSNESRRKLAKRYARVPPDAGTKDVTISDGGSCGPGEFLYRDRKCGAPVPPDTGVDHGCEQVGDGKCYEKCESDSECTDPARPHCSVLGLWDGGDWECNDTVKICRSTAQDDCSSKD